MSKPITIDWSKASRLVRRIRAASELEWDDLAAVAFTLFAIEQNNREVAAALRVLLDKAVDWQKVFKGQAGIALEQVEGVIIRIIAPQLARFLRQQYDRLDETARGQIVQDALERSGTFIELVLADDDKDAA